MGDCLSRIVFASRMVGLHGLDLDSHSAISSRMTEGRKNHEDVESSEIELCHKPSKTQTRLCQKI
jgi:hypothetical protein